MLPRLYLQHALDAFPGAKVLNNGTTAEEGCDADLMLARLQLSRPLQNGWTLFAHQVPGHALARAVEPRVTLDTF